MPMSPLSAMAFRLGLAGLLLVPGSAMSPQTVQAAGTLTALCGDLRQTDAPAKIEAALQRCRDARIRVFGPGPQNGGPGPLGMILQHPLVAAPGPLPFGKTGKPGASAYPEPHQSYLDIGGRQVILVSPGRLPCDPPLWVTGRLEAIDLGGPSHTKRGYSGWVIHVDNQACP